MDRKVDALIKARIKKLNALLGIIQGIIILAVEMIVTNRGD